MQISKTFLVVCAATLAIVPLSLPAADTEAQIRARDALEKKLSEMQAQDSAPAVKPPPPANRKQKQPAAEPAPAVKPPPTAQPPAPVVKPKPAPVIQPAPVVKPKPVPTPPPAPAPAPMVVQPRADSEAIAKAREALREKLKELEAQQSAPSAAAPPPPRVVTTPPSEPPPAAAPVASSSEPNPALSPAEQKKQDAAAARAQKEAQRRADKAPAYNRPIRFQPIDAPPVPFSADKQTRLAELLRKYQADELTPEQYHEARAKIVAEP
jgi:hypothetical protein